MNAVDSMSGVWAILLVFAVGMAALSWGVWLWAMVHLWSKRRRRGEPTHVQVEAREWPAAIGLGFTGLAVVAWLAV